MGRPVEPIVVPVEGMPLACALARGLEGARHPLVLVTTAQEPWTEAHLTPLLEAIDHCDHVIGHRPAGRWVRWKHWLSALPRRLIFAVPIRDIHSPCRLHRLEKLAAIPLQSASSFLDVEIIAKATFCGHLIDEVEVPALPGLVRAQGWWSDCRQLLRHPIFAGPSGPSEEAQGQGEGDDGPGREDRQGRAHIEQGGPVEQDTTQRVDQLGQGEGLDEPLGGIPEPLGREEDPREQPHRHHDQVHQPADGLGRTGSRGHEQADPREGQGTGHVDQDDHRQVPADGHSEHQGPQQ
jgi:hypothetical protein